MRPPERAADLDGASVEPLTSKPRRNESLRLRHHKRPPETDGAFVEPLTASPAEEVERKPRPAGDQRRRE